MYEKAKSAVNIQTALRSPGIESDIADEYRTDQALAHVMWTLERVL